MIEKIVFDKLITQLNDLKYIEKLDDSFINYQLKQMNDNAELNLIQSKLKSVDKSIANLIKAIEVGIVTESTKNRLSELEDNKNELQSALDRLLLETPKMIEKEEFLFWIDSLRKKDTADEQYQELLIDTFLNAVYLYDDGYIDIGTNLIKGTKRFDCSSLVKMVNAKGLEPMTPSTSRKCSPN